MLASGRNAIYNCLPHINATFITAMSIAGGRRRDFWQKLASWKR